jgi:hypothetical protein
VKSRLISWPNSDPNSRSPETGPPEQSQADAVQDTAAELTTPVEKVEAGLAAVEAQPRVIRELLMRQIAEAWLEGHRGLC